MWIFGYILLIIGILLGASASTLLIAGYPAMPRFVCSILLVLLGLSLVKREIPSPLEKIISARGMTSLPPMSLSIQNLTVSYGAITALRNITVEIAPGEIVALIGANGAGKTTLLKSISGLLHPESGSIIWSPRITNSIESVQAEAEKSLDYYSSFGDLPFADLVGMRADRIVRLGISHAPEGRQIFANLTVLDNLLLGAFQRRDRAEIQAGLERCFTLFPVLKERQGQRSGTLSGGEQQMLAIGRALMAKPRLLLLDEPSLGLAPLIVQRIFEIIREINRGGATILLVEQNAHMALSVAHRGYVLQSGHVTLADTAANLLANPQVKDAYLGG